MDHLSKLYKIQYINDSPKLINFSPDFQKKTRAIYLQKSSPKSTSPEKFKIYKLNIQNKNDNSLSPARSWYTLTNKKFNESNFIFSKNIFPNKNIFESSSKNHQPSSISEEMYNNITNNRSINGLKNSLKGPYKQANLSTITKTQRLGSASPSINSVFNKEKEDTPNSKERYINLNIVKNNNENLNNKEFKIKIEKSMNYTPLENIPRKFSNNNNLNIENVMNNGGTLNFNKFNNRTFNSPKNLSNNLNNNSIQNYNIITDINNYSFNQKSRNINMNNNEKNLTQDDNNQCDIQIQPIENIINTEIYINSEDLIYLEERLSNIVFVLNNKNNIFDIEMRNECVELYNFYFNSTLYGKFPLFFKEKNRLTIQSAFNLNLFVIIISYHLTTNFFMLMKLINSLQKIYNLLQINLFLFYRKIELFYGEEYTMKNETYFQRTNSVLEMNNLNDLNENQIIYVINQNCYNIVDIINYSILDYYNVIGNEYYEDFQKIFENISIMNEQEIYNYFFNNLLNPKDQKPKLKYYIPDNNYNNNITNNISIIKNDDNEKINDLIIEYLRNKESPPFVKNPCNKKFTIVLDIDETLVNVTFDSPDSTNGICKFRPGLIHFLKSIKPYYEIISFTTNSKEYSESIISQIEMGKKIFDYNLSREHSLLCGKEFIKDISRIGRDMRHIIIVDDKANNFKLNKENGILIFPYFGDDDNDVVLYELKKLLILFYKIGYSDLRRAIANYKDEINEKITKGFED